MAAVKQQVLNWLYSILTNEYKYLNRTYNDVAQLLSRYSSLSPRTDVYTYENGSSALLLNISGTIPVIFRGISYRFPITLWVPHLYPVEAPMAYVKPSEGMIVRPGQHVDLQGKIYHPYLVGWAENSNRCNFLEFIDLIRDIFAKEPPVMSRPQSNLSPLPPKPPPLPPNISRPTSHPTSHFSQKIEQVVSSSPPPPPPPPKPVNSNKQSLTSETQRWISGPPLPPLPKQSLYDDVNLNNKLNPPQNSDQSLRLDSNIPASQQASVQILQKPHDSFNSIPPLSTDPVHRQSQLNSASLQNLPHESVVSSYLEHQIYSHQKPQRSFSQINPPESPHVRPETPPDLLSAPLELTISSPTDTNCPAPPIPPNPEKDFLLQKIGHALHTQRQKARSQINSSLSGLQTQHNAMLTSLGKMDAEVKALESLNDILTVNMRILHSALQDADTVMSSSQHRKLPDIDELLVAPSVVANQLYDLVSEERSLGDAIFVLGRAVEKGRISATVFAKITRSLSREWYLKKALIRKIGRGMGLMTH